MMSRNGRCICPNLCGRSFKNQINLRFHCRNECGLLFSCTLCYKSYSQKSHLKRHLALIHKISLN